jgi:hypothetical protein
MSSEVPDPVSGDVRHHVCHKSKPIQELIDNAYKYWNRITLRIEWTR